MPRERPPGYDERALNISKRVQWLVEITLDGCAHTYGQDPCGVDPALGGTGDLGDGKRCDYSWRTCQAVDTFERTDRVLRFHLNNVPWADLRHPAYPLLKSIVSIPQSIQTDRLMTYPESIELRMHADFGHEMDPVKTVRNTGSDQGEFWSSLFWNFEVMGRPLRVLRGFSPTDGSPFLLEDFVQQGPVFEINGARVDETEWVIKAESPLAEMSKKKCPNAISDDNKLQIELDDTQQTVHVFDAAEYPDPSELENQRVWIRMPIEPETDPETYEIMLVRSRDIVNHTLSVDRGAAGTSASIHSVGVKVENIAMFGDFDTNGPNNAPLPYDVATAIQELLEWAGVQSSEWNQDGIQRVVDEYGSRLDVLRTISNPYDVAALLTPLREARGIAVFIDATGLWSMQVAVPGLDETPLYFAEMNNRTVAVTQDDDSRVTMIEFFYDPIDPDETGDDPKDYRRSVVLVDRDAEDPNSYGRRRRRRLADPWTDKDVAPADIRTMLLRYLNQHAAGLVTVDFTLEIGSGTGLDVGDLVRIYVPLFIDDEGIPIPISAMIVKRSDEGRDKLRFSALATTDPYAGQKPFRIGPDTIADDYLNATEEDKARGGYWSDENGRLPDGEEGYRYF